MAYTVTTDYSFAEVTAPKPLKVGDKIRYDTLEMGATSGYRQLTNAPVGTVLKSPKGDIVIREPSGKISTYYSHNAKAHVFQSGEYKVLDVPEAPKADPVGDLVVELGKAKWGTAFGTADDSWTRKDNPSRKQAEWVRKNFIRTGTKVITDNLDADPWYQLPNGKFSLARDNAGEGVTRDYIRREYGIRYEFTLQ